jgi:hypothetical protein
VAGGEGVKTTKIKYIGSIVPNACLLYFLCTVLCNTSSFNYVQFKKIKHIPVYNGPVLIATAVAKQQTEECTQDSGGGEG